MGLLSFWGGGWRKWKKFYEKSRKKVLTRQEMCDIMGKVKQVAFATSTNSEESEEYLRSL